MIGADTDEWGMNFAPPSSLSAALAFTKAHGDEFRMNFG